VNAPLQRHRRLVVQQPGEPVVAVEERDDEHRYRGGERELRAELRALA
jgi:hypothetical protein